MRTIKMSFKDMLANTSPSIQKEVSMEFAISNGIYELMEKHGLTKMEFAKALGRRPSDITKWLSGQHNFTIKTLSMLSSFFGKSLFSAENTEKYLFD